MDAEVWKVFVPCDLLIQSEDSFLLGHVSCNHQSIYITASCEDVSEVQNSSLELIGQWKNEISSKQNQINCSKSAWINLWTDLHQSVHCSVFIDKSKVSCTIIIYNPKDLLNSSVLTRHVDHFRGEGDSTVCLVNILKSVQVLDSGEHESAVLYYGNQPDNRNILGYIVCFLLWNFIHIYTPFRWLLISG